MPRRSEVDELREQLMAARLDIAVAAASAEHAVNLLADLVAAFIRDHLWELVLSALPSELVEQLVDFAGQPPKPTLH